MKKPLLKVALACVIVGICVACEPNVPGATGDDSFEEETIPTLPTDAADEPDDEPDEVEPDDRANPNPNPEAGNPIADSFNAQFLPLRAMTHSVSAVENSNDFTHLPNAKIGWGLGSAVDENNRPVDALNANRDYGSLGAVFIGESSENPEYAPTVFLTFDEGYENGCTASILDVLKSRGVRATFFVTHDYCVKVPDLVQRMIDEGHTVGNHSYTHPSFPECDVEHIREEIALLHDYVKETFDYEMTLIRFPMGEFSQRSLAVAQSMGYTSVFWSFAYMDWNVNNQPESTAALDKIKTATHPGAIVLLHAVSQTNAAILGELVDFWKSEGYRLGIIGEDFDDNSGNNPAVVSSKIIIF